MPQLEKGITFAFVEFLLSGIAANLVDSASRRRLRRLRIDVSSIPGYPSSVFAVANLGAKGTPYHLATALFFSGCPFYE